MSEVVAKIGHLIREKRKSVGMSQLVLANKMGCKPSLVSKWERGAIVPSLAQVESLEKILNIGVLINKFVRSAK